jgi:hypothetical protein
MLIRNHPGYRVFISPASIFGSILPRIKGFRLGGNFGFDEKHERGCLVTFGQFVVRQVLTMLPKAFKQAGWDVVSAVSAWPTVTTALFVADAGLIKVK